VTDHAHCSLSFDFDSRFETMLSFDELKHLIVSYRVVTIGPIREDCCSR
jgi:hypothetical protein